MPEDKAMEHQEALKRAAALCSRQEQCSSHIRAKLLAWKLSEENAAKIIDLLIEDNFLDDSRYASFYVRDKYKFNGWGKIKMAVMLRQKEIPESTIKEALDQIDQESYEQTCRCLIKEKSDSLKETNQFKRKGKLFRFAAQRGFESELIHQILSYL